MKARRVPPAEIPPTGNVRVVDSATLNTQPGVARKVTLLLITDPDVSSRQFAEAVLNQVRTISLVRYASLIEVSEAEEKAPVPGHGPQPGA